VSSASRAALAAAAAYGSSVTAIPSLGMPLHLLRPRPAAK
jgi:hypothetical protein